MNTGEQSKSTESIVPTNEIGAGALDSFFKGVDFTQGKDADEPKPADEDNKPKEEEKLEEEPEKKLEEEPEKKKPEVVEEEAEEDNTDSVILKVAGAFGDVELEGEFDDDEEGLINVTKQIVDKKVAIARGEAVEDLFEKNPLLKQVNEHLGKGGSLFTLLQGQQVEDFSKREIKEDDVEAQTNMVRTALQAQGLPEKKIEILINNAKDEGTLFEEANESKSFLVDKQKDIIAANLKEEEEEFKAEEERQLKVKSDVKEIIKERKLHGMTLTDGDATDLENFTLVQDNKGRTRRDVAYEELTVEEWLTLDNLVRTKFKALKDAKDAPAPKKSTKLTIKKSKATIDIASSGKGGSTTTKGGLGALGLDKPSDFFNK